MKAITFLLMSVALMACDLALMEPGYDERNYITGSYWVEEYSHTYNSYARFPVTIRKAGYGEVRIDNFYDVNISVQAHYDNGKIYIYRQVVNGYEVEGVGTVYGNDIEFSYKVRDTYTYKPVDFCHAKAR
jgi:hypothetical protein